MTHVLEAVLAFDGKHVDELRFAAERVLEADGGALVELCSSDDPLHRVAATWIVKAVLEDGRGQTLDLGKYFSCLKDETEWGALLHLLQSVQLAPKAASNHWDAVRRLLDHKKTLVAVWALDALVRIAVETGEGLEEAHRRVEAALAHEKASMRARARHLAPLLGL
ncbi:MAG: hypothetical protein QNJ20_05835 [Paracoccaceae bacterium]|nr:hypothetical protein [Paracoccaceae bacterium]